jgi:hypothetical protein
MDMINPLATSLYQSTQLQEQQSVEKQRIIRRAQAMEKDVAAKDDELEHQVESAEEPTAIHDEEPDNDEPREQKQSRKGAKEEPPHLDLTA